MLGVDSGIRKEAPGQALTGDTAGAAGTAVTADAAITGGSSGSPVTDVSPVTDGSAITDGSAASDGSAIADGLEIRAVRNIEVAGFRVLCSDLTFRLDTRVDLERLVTAAPARWAVSSLAEQPLDTTRQARAVVAVQAAGQGLPEGTARFDLAVVRIDGGGILGGVLILLGASPLPDDRLAYVLTPDVALADSLAGHKGRPASEFVDGVRPLEARGDDESEWGRRVQQTLERFHPVLTSSPGVQASGLAIVRAQPAGPPAGGRHVKPRLSFRRLGTTVRRTASVSALRRTSLDS